MNKTDDETGLGCPPGVKPLFVFTSTSTISWAIILSDWANSAGDRALSPRVSVISLCSTSTFISFTFFTSSVNWVGSVRKTTSVYDWAIVNHRADRRGLGSARESGVASKQSQGCPLGGRGSPTLVGIWSGPVARTIAARPLLAVLFWSTIRFLVVGRRGTGGRR